MWQKYRFPKASIITFGTNPRPSRGYELCPIEMGTWGKVSQWCNRLLGIFRFRGWFRSGKRRARSALPRGGGEGYSVADQHRGTGPRDRRRPAHHAGNWSWEDGLTVVFQPAS